MLFAVVAGGAAWAVGVPVAAAAGVGAAVLGAKALLGSLLDREKGIGARILPVRGHSIEERWLKRAEHASRSFDELTSSSRPGPIAEKIAIVGEQVRSTLDTVRGLAGQASAVAAALQHVEQPSLERERARLRADARRAASDEIRTELQRSMQSVEAQLAVHGRLAEAGRTLVARLESGTIGLEALVARLAEILALSHTATSPQSLDRIAELGDELEGLRAGLKETEDLSRRALSAYREQA